MPTVFDRYPQLRTLRGLVPDDVVEREVGQSADKFEASLEVARRTIPTVRLRDVFPSDVERGAIRLEDFLGHWGNVSVEELCKICLIVAYLRPKTLLEIGTYNGLTTLQMALNAPHGSTVYSLDLPPGVKPELGLSTIDGYVAMQFRDHFQTATGSYFAGRDDVSIRQLLGDAFTFDYASAIHDPIDLIFVDAAHDYESKRRDSENALNLLSPNGVILWHNYADVTCPDVTRYLAELSRKLEIFHLRGTSIAVHWRGRA